MLYGSTITAAVTAVTNFPFSEMDLSLSKTPEARSRYSQGVPRCGMLVVVGSYEGIIMNPKGWCALAGITIALMVAVLPVVRAAADDWDTCEKASGDAAIAACTPGDLACPWRSSKPLIARLIEV